MQEKAPTSMHSVRLGPTKLVLVGTRTTYQATKPPGTPDTAGHTNFNFFNTISLLRQDIRPDRTPTIFPCIRTQHTLHAPLPLSVCIYFSRYLFTTEQQNKKKVSSLTDSRTGSLTPLGPSKQTLSVSRRFSK